MSCFPCFSSEKPNPIKINDLPVIQAAAKPALPSSLPAGIYVNLLRILIIQFVQVELYFLALLYFLYSFKKKQKKGR